MKKRRKFFYSWLNDNENWLVPILVMGICMCNFCIFINLFTRNDDELWMAIIKTSVCTMVLTILSVLIMVHILALLYDRSFRKRFGERPSARVKKEKQEQDWWGHCLHLFRSFNINMITNINITLFELCYYLEQIYKENGIKCLQFIKKYDKLMCVINHTERVLKEVPWKKGPKKQRTLWKFNKKGGI